MHPDKPVLKKEKEDPWKVSFLGLSTEVHNRKFTIFVVRFHISHMPHSGSNTPSKVFYASIGSGIYYIARETADDLIHKL